MSELKAYRFVLATENSNLGGVVYTSKYVYAQDDVDKLLAKKDKEIAKLKAENERLKKCEIWMKQHFYCEEVIACESAKNRQLKRALWLERAEHASDKARIFYFAETCGVKLNINGYSTKEKGCTRMCTARWWMITWLKVERKCRAKAEEYK